MGEMEEDTQHSPLVSEPSYLSPHMRALTEISKKEC